MELATTEEEILAEIALPALDPAGNGRGRCPPENPAIDRIPNDPLLVPHPAEPGVKPDGTAAPLENPGGRRNGGPADADMDAAKRGP
jgi:hypothetical protein